MQVAEMWVRIFFGHSPPSCTAGSSVTHILHRCGRSHPLPQWGDHGPQSGAAPQCVPHGVGATMASSLLAPHLSSLLPALLKATV